MRIRQTCIILATAVFCGSAALSHARVFRRWWAGSHGIAALENTGGEIAYETSININGGKGQLTVFNFDSTIDRVIVDLKKTFGSEGFVFSGGTMGHALIKKKGRALRLFAIMLEDQGPTIVFAVEQSLTEFKESGTPPKTETLQGIPVFPGSESVFFAKNDDSGLALAVATSDSSVSGVQGFFKSELSAAGWTPALPEVKSVSEGPQMMIFLKDSRICCVYVDPSEISAKTRITVLDKAYSSK
jgi:hypothetical protein